MEKTFAASPNPSEGAAVQTGVPRRYGVGTLLVITTLYSILFAFLRSVGAPPAVFVVVALYLAGIGAAQMLLFQGERPREASILTGSALFVLLWVIGGTMLLATNSAGPKQEGLPVLTQVTLLREKIRRSGPFRERKSNGDSVSSAERRCSEDLLACIYRKA
jgi:hypothetical protein